MDDFRDFSTEVEDFVDTAQTSNREEKPSNYLEPYLVDSWARSRGKEPIEFDWGNVCDVTAVELDKAWATNPLKLAAEKRGKKYNRALVFCPNPRHGYFKQVFPDPPLEHSYKCNECITDEMNRIFSLRVRRDENERKFADERE